MYEQWLMLLKDRLSNVALMHIEMI